MQMRYIEKLGISVSAFGLGCMRFPMVKDASGKDVIDEKKATEIIRTAIDAGVNYIDTAYVYSGGLNEKCVGKALGDGYRKKVYLATKLPPLKCHTKEDMYKIFEEQCENLKTDCIDFYLLHALCKERIEHLKKLGVFEFLDDLKKKGRIKYACFSFHDSYEVFEEIINLYDWDMCQIQFNYMDIETQAGIKGLELAGKKGIPVVIMEGLLGGKLANVPQDVKEVFDSYPEKRSPHEWAFRYLCNFPQIATVLSGTTSIEQTKDNLEIFDRTYVGCMTEEEQKIIEKARQTYKERIKVDCTGCRYCMPCPMGVEIPRIFSLWNSFSMYDQKPWGYSALENENKGVNACVECGKCIKECPQGLKIPLLLKKAREDLE